MYTFNLFGDPSLTREGIDVASVVVDTEGSKIAPGAGIEAVPNPARGMVTVRYYMPSPTASALEVFDVLGRRVRRLEVSDNNRGWHEVSWDACRDDGRPVASGIYWVRLSLPEETVAVRILTIR
jgi:hypothetical protein